jgi:hypothetical protein
MEAKEIIDALQSGKINAEQATRLIEGYERKKTKKKEPKLKRKSQN